MSIDFNKNQISKINNSIALNDAAFELVHNTRIDIELEIFGEDAFDKLKVSDLKELSDNVQDSEKQLITAASSGIYKDFLENSLFRKQVNQAKRQIMDKML